MGEIKVLICFLGTPRSPSGPLSVLPELKRFDCKLIAGSVERSRLYFESPPHISAPFLV